MDGPVTARGVRRWSKKEGQGEVWRAQVETAPGNFFELSKAQYEISGIEPPFWQLPRERHSYSDIVNAGMKRLCADLTPRLASLGFAKTGRRQWARVGPYAVEAIHLHRSGSSYGAPINASVYLRVELIAHVLNEPEVGGLIYEPSDHVRRADGRAYHHRFNAETWSTYELCLEHLDEFISGHAEPFFADLRDPDRLMKRFEAAPAMQIKVRASMAGNADAESVAKTLRRYGIKARKRSKRPPD